MEDKNTTISTQLISASLTMITVVSAFTVFIIEKREVGLFYCIIVGLAFFCFVTSIFLGGLGLSGRGNELSPNPFFNLQAITAIIGVVFFCISVFFGKEKPDNLEKKVEELHKTIIELNTKDEFRVKEMQGLKEDLSKLTKQIEEMQIVIELDNAPLKEKQSVNNQK